MITTHYKNYGRHIAIILSVFIICFLKTAFAQKPLTLVTKHTPPFVFKHDDGRWSGPSIELWQAIADKHRFDYRIREMTLSEMLNTVAHGEVDVAIGALSITAERERRFDFTHPFHTTGLGIAVPMQDNNAVTAILGRLISVPFLKAVVLLIGVLFVLGLIIYFLERRQNDDQFGGGFWRGVGSGFWWAAVTMTTVGYGDKSPETFLGRVLALTWMFTALITVSGFVAAIASSLTAEQLSTVNEPADLSNVVIGTVQESSSAGFLSQNGYRSVAYGSLTEALTALDASEVEAVVYDLPLLRYVWEQDSQQSFTILPYTLNKEQYAFALPTGSPLRESINQEILKVIATTAWQDKLRRY